MEFSSSEMSLNETLISPATSSSKDFCQSAWIQDYLQILHNEILSQIFAWVSKKNIELLFIIHALPTACILSSSIFFKCLSAPDFGYQPGHPYFPVVSLISAQLCTAMTYKNTEKTQHRKSPRSLMSPPRQRFYLFQYPTH